MVRFSIFMLALLLTAGGFAIAVADGARSMAASEITFLSVHNGLDMLKSGLANQLLQQLGSEAGQSIAFVLDLPAFFILWGLGVVLFLILNRRQPDIGYLSRR
jgi:hypothetical protein